MADKQLDKNWIGYRIVMFAGFVIDFISIPVTAGFTSAAAITIASSQVKGLFGLEITEHSHIEGVQGTWIDIVKNFKSFRYQDTILGFICIAILLLLRVSEMREKSFLVRIFQFETRFSDYKKC